MSVLGYSQLLKSSTSPSGGFTLVASTSEQPSAAGAAIAVTTQTPINTTGAGLIVIGIVDWPDFTPGAPGSITDSKGNTGWSTAVSRATANQRVTIFFKVAPVVGTNHTFSYNIAGVASTWPTIYVWAYTGGTALDVTNSNSTTSSSTSLATGNINPTSNGELIVTLFGGYPATSQPSISGGGFTSGNQLAWYPYVFNRNANSAGYALVQTSAAATNPTHSYGTSSQAVVAIAAFK